MLSFMGLTIALQSAQGASSVPPLPEKTFGKCGGIGPFPREATLQSEWPWTGAGRLNQGHGRVWEVRGTGNMVILCHACPQSPQPFLESRPTLEE